MQKAIAACGHLGACADENDRRFTPAVKTIRHGELTLPVFLFQLVDGVEKDHEAVPFFFVHHIQSVSSPDVRRRKTCYVTPSSTSTAY